MGRAGIHGSSACLAAFAIACGAPSRPVKTLELETGRIEAVVTDEALAEAIAQSEKSVYEAIEKLRLLYEK